MTTATTIIMGVTAISFVLFFLITLLDRKNPFHSVIRAITMLFIIAILPLIPKATIDANTVCEVVVNQSTEVNSTVVEYTYTDFCYNRTENTSTAFFKGYAWYLRIFIIWLFLFFAGMLFLQGKDYAEAVGKFWRKKR